MIYPATFEHKTGFDTIREYVKEKCISPLGAAHVDRMAFCTDFDIVKTRLEAVAEMMAVINADDGFSLENIYDVTDRLRSIRVPGTFIPAGELYRIMRSLESIAVIGTYFRSHRTEEGKSPYPTLDDMAQGLMEFPTIIKAIDRITDHFGNVKDTASDILAGIRHQLASVSSAISSIMRKVIAKAVNEGYIESDTTPTMRDGRLVIPVPPMHKRNVRGIVHDESASGKTVFIEPAEIVETNNRLRELQIEEHREIVRILTVLADEIRPMLPDMLASYDILGSFDFIHAKSVFAAETESTLPTLHNKPELEWYHACHPVLRKSLENQGRKIVPLDILLSKENRILIISGPNAGGKSVTLKTAAVIQYMAQCGMLPPVYENSHLGLFDDIFINIGDDQSIEDDLSTYSSHLRNMKYMLNHGTSRTMILIDEFGAGTEPLVGGAIAQALLEKFNSMYMWGIITTHFQNLKHFAEETSGLINGSMLYDRREMLPLFQLSIGHPGSSFAIEIARKTGLPADIIDKACEIVGSDYVNLDKYLLDIARDKRYWENKRLSIKQKEKKIGQVLERYQNDADTLREKRREIINDAQKEARRILEDSNAAIERTIHDIKTAKAERERTLEARHKLQQKKQLLSDDTTYADSHPLLNKAPANKKKKTGQESDKQQTAQPLHVGEYVKLDGEGVPGKILEINGKNAIVAFGQLKTNITLARLKRTIQKTQTNAARTTPTVSVNTADESRARQLAFNREIDIRGMRVDEGVQAVTYFIDDAIQFSAGKVRILHGTGTGALRQYVRNYLDTVPGVKSYHDEHVQFGGAGITVVELD